MSCCPLCNGLSQVYLLCPNCGGVLEDKGRIENYFDPYSPYLGEELIAENDGAAPECCVHLFSCPLCGYDHPWIISHINDDGVSSP